MGKKDWIFEDAVVRVLTEAGREGLSVNCIAHYVFNAHNSFFAPLEYNKVHQQVYQYLLRKSKEASAPIERLPLRGRYRLNPEPLPYSQLMFPFADDATDGVAEDKPEEESPLSLF